MVGYLTMIKKKTTKSKSKTSISFEPRRLMNQA